MQLHDSPAEPDSELRIILGDGDVGPQQRAARKMPLFGTDPMQQLPGRRQISGLAPCFCQLAKIVGDRGRVFR